MPQSDGLSARPADEPRVRGPRSGRSLLQADLVLPGFAMPGPTSVVASATLHPTQNDVGQSLLLIVQGSIKGLEHIVERLQPVGTLAHTLSRPINPVG